MSKTSAEVVVVGAGVAGLACAAYLAKAGVEVVVVERLPGPGQGSTARANGGIRAQWSTALNIEFSKFSIAEYERWNIELDGLPGLVQAGYLFIAGTEAAERYLRANCALQRRHGVQTEWLLPEDVVAKAPFIRTEGLRCGTFHAKDGFIDPHGAAMTFAMLARRAGVEIRYEAEVSAIRTTPAGGFEIDVPGGALRAGTLVNAAGPDAAEIARHLGVDLPVQPIRRNLACTDPVPGSPAVIPMCIDLDTGVLVRKESGGYLIAWSDPKDAPGRETHLDPDFLEKLAERIGNRFPFLESVPIDPRRCWAGLYPETPDHHAIVGTTPGVPGFLQAVGFGGHGIMHAPATGKAIQELVTDGRSSTFDLHAFRFERFAEGDLVKETAVL